MRQHSTKWSTISEVLKGVKLAKTVKSHLKHHEVWSKWNAIVGTELGRVTKPSHLRDKALTINVVHQAWAQQLHFLTPSILGKIRNICPHSDIQKLYFQVGPVESEEPQAVLNHTEAKLKSVKLSERLEMTLRSIDDEALRSQIRLAMEAACRRSTA